jgi:polyphosphate kinase 2 (PPK2 family)
MGFCTSEEHHEFLREVPQFEDMLVKSGIILLKFYFSVSKKEQSSRFEKRETDPLKQYKLSPVDKESQMLWDKYTIAKFSMLMASNTEACPWTIVRSDNKKAARINCIKHILNRVEYPDKTKEKNTKEDKEIIISGSNEIELMEEQNTFAKVL